jgi:NAD+ diphosphatase
LLAVKEPIPYSGNPLDRMSGRRTDAAWLSERLGDPSSRFLPLWRMQVLVKQGHEPDLAWARRGVCECMTPDPGPVLLGEREGVTHFAVDLSTLSDPLDALGLGGEARFAEPHAVVAGLPLGSAGIVAQARGLLTWHARHRFCGTCGEPTRSADAGHVRRCPSCSAEHFPRTDPVVIMLPVRGDQCLLGRQPAFPKGMWSALAGFLEPGETIEEAVRREVAEESGVRVGAVRYRASQPWPFPASLMIGCLADAESEAIEVARDELEDARWFGRDELARALAGKHPEMFVPPPMAIAHHLIRSWLSDA